MLSTTCPWLHTAACISLALTSRRNESTPLIMGDDHQLEVGLRSSLRHNLAQGICKGSRVGLIQICGRLIQGQDATVQAESLCKRQADNEACQHLRTQHSSPALPIVLLKGVCTISIML